MSEIHMLIAREIVENQRDDVAVENKLSINDINRLSKKINESVFSPNECCIWHGHVTNQNHPNKGRYVNFYFKRKKVALHRLLYMNLIGDLGDDDYLKFNCPNRGMCCNMLHLKKFKYEIMPMKQLPPSHSNKKECDITIIYANDFHHDWEKYKHKFQVRFF